MNQNVENALKQLEKIILGKAQKNKLALTCILSKGHLLIEDVPGVGKTTLALSLAKIFSLQFQRIQFTNDLLPADILGASIYEANNSGFTFHKGPIFSQVVLADEINRASPKTQSALLEAMEEHQVTIEGNTYALPEPFFVVATKNPNKQLGTFPLPESQLDRFLMSISLGYPDEASEIELLQGKDRRDMMVENISNLNVDILHTLQVEVTKVHTSTALLSYIMNLVKATRNHPSITLGLSPRGSLALKKCAQAWAFIDGRNVVIPEDVQAIFIAVCEHRIQTSGNSTQICEQLIKNTKIP